MGADDDKVGAQVLRGGVDLTPCGALPEHGAFFTGVAQ
jgi:hypothetical protein